MPQTCPANSEPLGQISFWRQAISGSQLAFSDHVADLNHDLLGRQTVLFWSDHPESAEFDRSVTVSGHPGRLYFLPQPYDRREVMTMLAL